MQKDDLKLLKKAIAYYRVSTERQGQSGLGLEAQREAVNTFAQHQSYQVQKEFTEVESGNKILRPQLMEALQQCRKERATLIIAKLDRLGRNVAFIANLMESKVDFVAVDNPQATPLILHILAAFAEHERKQISARTKDALQAAKRRGIKLGKHGRKVLSKRNKTAAQQFAKKMKPIIESINQEGYITLRSLTNELNLRNIPTYRKGSRWHMQSVQRLKKRLS